MSRINSASSAHPVGPSPNWAARQRHGCRRRSKRNAARGFKGILHKTRPSHRKRPSGPAANGCRWLAVNEVVLGFGKRTAQKMMTVAANRTLTSDLDQLTFAEIHSFSPMPKVPRTVLWPRRANKLQDFIGRERVQIRRQRRICRKTPSRFHSMTTSAVRAASAAGDCRRN
jgi:hypothetical protein